MTNQNSLKRRIRERISKTGESYSTARLAILNSQIVEPAAQLSVTLAQPTSRSGNLETDIAAALQAGVPRCDILVLPELIGGSTDFNVYQDTIKRLAKTNECAVVGGSCYQESDDGVINAGFVVDKKGQTLCHYEKLHPYGTENESGILSGDKMGQFEIEGRQLAVMICSDLWFSKSVDLLEYVPDVLLIPSFSITQRDDPRKARQLWQHMAVSRAYEHSAYVGVCDWAHPCEFDGLPAAGVSGFADPRPNGEHFFEANLAQPTRTYALDFERLDAFRENRASRGFSSRLPKD